jgi:putative transposase
LERLEAAFHKGKLSFFGELAGLHDPAEFLRTLEPQRESEWVVYARAPFGGPSQVLDYLGRYTHRVALSNERLLEVKDGQVTFQWKDYRVKGSQKSDSSASGSLDCSRTATGRWHWQPAAVLLAGPMASNPLYGV